MRGVEGPPPLPADKYPFAFVAKQGLLLASHAPDGRGSAKTALQIAAKLGDKAGRYHVAIDSSRGAYAIVADRLCCGLIVLSDYEHEADDALAFLSALRQRFLDTYGPAAVADLAAGGPGELGAEARGLEAYRAFGSAIAELMVGERLWPVDLGPAGAMRMVGAVAAAGPGSGSGSSASQLDAGGRDRGRAAGLGGWQRETELELASMTARDTLAARGTAAPAEADDRDMAAAPIGGSSRGTRKAGLSAGRSNKGGKSAAGSKATTNGSRSGRALREAGGSNTKRGGAAAPAPAEDVDDLEGGPPAGGAGQATAGSRAAADHDSGPGAEAAQAAKPPNFFARKMGDVRSQVAAVQAVMSRNIDAVLARGQSLEGLQARTEDLRGSAEQFRTRSRTMRRTLWMQGLKWTLIAIGVALLLAALLFLAICRGLTCVGVGHA